MIKDPTPVHRSTLLVLTRERRSAAPTVQTPLACFTSHSGHFTNEEWNTLSHVGLPSDVDWDPSILDHRLSDDVEWYNAQEKASNLTRAWFQTRSTLSSLPLIPTQSLLTTPNSSSFLTLSKLKHNSKSPIRWSKNARNLIMPGTKSTSWWCLLRCLNTHFSARPKWHTRAKYLFSMQSIGTVLHSQRSMSGEQMKTLQPTLSTPTLLLYGGLWECTNLCWLWHKVHQSLPY